MRIILAHYISLSFYSGALDLPSTFASNGNANADVAIGGLGVAAAIGANAS